MTWWQRGSLLSRLDHVLGGNARSSTLLRAGSGAQCVHALGREGASELRREFCRPVLRKFLLRGSQARLRHRLATRNAIAICHGCDDNSAGRIVCCCCLAVMITDRSKRRSKRAVVCREDAHTKAGTGTALSRRLFGEICFASQVTPQARLSLALCLQALPQSPCPATVSVSIAGRWSMGEGGRNDGRSVFFVRAAPGAEGVVCVVCGREKSV
jgi:hypothetical protein